MGWLIATKHSSEVIYGDCSGIPLEARLGSKGVPRQQSLHRGEQHRDQESRCWSGWSSALRAMRRQRGRPLSNQAGAFCFALKSFERTFPERQLPVWACRFAVVDVPEAAQGAYRQAVLQRGCHCSEPIAARAMESYCWLSVRVSRSTLTRFVRLDSGVSQHLHCITDPTVKRSFGV